MWEDLVQIDRDIFVLLNRSWLGKCDTFWTLITQIEYWIPLYLFVFYLFYKKLKRPANFIAIGSVFLVASVTLSLTNLVKNYVARLRPNNEPLLMDSIQILQTPENFSFWSGHSAVSFAVTSFCTLILSKNMKHRWIYLMYLWPVSFAFSRIFVGVHYPADITVGMIVGILLGFAFAKAFILTVTHFNNRLPL